MSFMILLIMMVSAGWGIAFISIAILLEYMTPMQLLAMRWDITALIFAVLVIAGRLRISLKGKKVLYLILPGLFEPCAYSILEAYGIKMTSASISAIFVASIPCMTLIIGILFFRHKADLRLVVSILLTFAGVMTATVFSPLFSAGGTKAGFFCMGAGVVAASLYSLCSKKASDGFDAASVTAVMAFEGAVLFSCIALAQGHGPETFLLLFADWRVMGNMLFLAVFCAFASYLCYNWLLHYADAALVTNIVGSLSTVIGVAAGIIVMGDVWGWYTAAGLIITLAGVWLSTMRMKDDL